MLDENMLEQIDALLEEMTDLSTGHEVLHEGLFKKNPDKILSNILKNDIIENYKWYASYYDSDGPNNKNLNNILSIFKRKPNSDNELYTVLNQIFLPLLSNYESGEIALLIIEKSKSEKLVQKIKDEEYFSVVVGSKTFTIDGKKMLNNSAEKILQEKIKLIDLAEKYIDMRNIGDEARDNLKAALNRWRHPITSYAPNINKRLIATVKKIKEIEKEK